MYLFYLEWSNKIKKFYFQEFIYTSKEIYIQVRAASQKSERIGEIDKIFQSLGVLLRERCERLNGGAPSRLRGVRDLERRPLAGTGATEFDLDRVMGGAAGGSAGWPSEFDSFSGDGGIKLRLGIDITAAVPS
jgi:hypothetical protein